MNRFLLGLIAALPILVLGLGGWRSMDGAADGGVASSGTGQ